MFKLRQHSTAVQNDKVIKVGNINNSSCMQLKAIKL